MAKTTKLSATVAKTALLSALQRRKTTSRYGLKESSCVVNSFYTAEQIKFYKLDDRANQDTVGETRDVNYFVADEIRDKQSKEVMKVIFETENLTFITVEQMSFLVSELQYRWVGELA